MIANIEINHLPSYHLQKFDHFLIAIVVNSILSIVISQPIFYYFGSINCPAWPIIIISCTIIAEVSIDNWSFIRFLTIVWSKNRISIICFYYKIPAIRITKHHFSPFFSEPIAFIDIVTILYATSKKYNQSNSDNW